MCCKSYGAIFIYMYKKKAVDTFIKITFITQNPQKN